MFGGEDMGVGALGTVVRERVIGTVKEGVMGTVMEGGWGIAVEGEGVVPKITRTPVATLMVVVAVDGDEGSRTNPRPRPCRWASFVGGLGSGRPRPTPTRTRWSPSPVGCRSGGVEVDGEVVLSSITTSTAVMTSTLR